MGTKGDRMKKLLLAALLSISSLANAVELGLVSTYNTNTTTVGQGVTLGEKFGDFGIQYGFFDSTNNQGLWQHKSSFTGSYTFYKIDKFAFNVKAGAAYINKQNSTADGWTSISGLGTSYAITPDTKLTLDWVHQYTSDHVMSTYNANIAQAGIKVSF
jgi:hypothetical protein